MRDKTMIKNNLPFVGAATALVTPMNDDLSIDYVSFGRMIDFQISSGIDALLILGTTGESSTLSDIERRECIEYSVTKVNGRVPIIFGTGSNDTRRAAEFSRFACSEGADGVLVVTPYYNKTTDQGLIRHYFTVADACDKPVILYNIPSRTGMNISLPVYKELAKHDNIVGTKEASGNISAICELISVVGDSLAVYSGNDAETVPIMAAGGVGVFSVLSNIMPREVASTASLMLNCKVNAAAENANKLSALTKALFCEVNPIPVKYASELLGLCRSFTRPPLYGMTEEHKALLQNEMKKLGLI